MLGRGTAGTQEQQGIARTLGRNAWWLEAEPEGVHHGGSLSSHLLRRPRAVQSMGDGAMGMVRLPRVLR